MSTFGYGQGKYIQFLSLWSYIHAAFSVKLKKIGTEIPILT